MYTNRMGHVTSATLTKDELNVLWNALKVLEEHGQLPGSTGIIDPEAVEKLIVETAKAFNYYSDRWGPISEATCKERQEHCARQVKLAKITEERHQKEIDRVAKRFIARENKEGLGKISSEGITEKDIAEYKTDMSHVQKVKKKKGKKK